MTCFVFAVYRKIWEKRLIEKGIGKQMGARTWRFGKLSAYAESAAKGLSIWLIKNLLKRRQVTHESNQPPQQKLGIEIRLSRKAFGKKRRKESEVIQSCLTLCDPMDCSPPGSSVHGILQARILEWVATPSPGDLPHPGMEPRPPTLQVDSLPSEPPGKPSYLT